MKDESGHMKLESPSACLPEPMVLAILCRLSLKPILVTTAALRFGCADPTSVVVSGYYAQGDMLISV